MQKEVSWHFGCALDGIFGLLLKAFKRCNMEYEERRVLQKLICHGVAVFRRRFTTSDWEISIMLMFLFASTLADIMRCDPYLCKSGWNHQSSIATHTISVWCFFASSVSEYSNQLFHPNTGGHWGISERVPNRKGKQLWKGQLRYWRLMLAFFFKSQHREYHAPHPHPSNYSHLAGPQQKTGFGSYKTIAGGFICFSNFHPYLGEMIR